MNERFEQLCSWSVQASQLCEELETLLARERTALIAFRGDELTEITMSKQMLAQKLLNIRSTIRQAVGKWWGVDAMDGLLDKLSATEQQRWVALHETWQNRWRHLSGAMERNQRFLQHSQRNLGKLIANWRRLTGQGPLYSAKGQKVEAASPGKMIVAQY